MENPIITLTTDWSTRDFFVGRVKGWLMSHIPEVRIVDITHSVNVFDLNCAIFVVKNGCLEFPPGTIHIIDVDTGNGEAADYVVVEYKQQYFLCADNGLPSAVFGKDYTSAYKLRTHEGYANTFVAYDLYCRVAEKIASGESIDSLGVLKESLLERVPLGYSTTKDGLLLYVSYIDSYGNAYLSITRNEFEQIAAGRKFEFQFREYRASEISLYYQPLSPNQAHKANMLIVESTTGHLQLALPKMSAEQLLGIRVQASVTVVFS